MPAHMISCFSGGRVVASWTGPVAKALARDSQVG